MLPDPENGTGIANGNVEIQYVKPSGYLSGLFQLDEPSIFPLARP